MVRADEEARARLFREQEARRCAARTARETALAGSGADAAAVREAWLPFLMDDPPVACEDEDEEPPKRLRSLSA